MGLFTSKAALAARVDELTAQVAELQSRLSVADGRSSLNAERIVRTHASLQNLAEDFETVSQHVRALTTARTEAPQPKSEET